MIVGFIRELVQHYNEKSYWKMRQYVQNNPRGGVRRLYYAFRVKRMDAFANASTGISLNGISAHFDSPPRLPHGLYGIIIVPGAKIGKNVRICHQVTIGNDFKDITHVPTIGDNVEIYPGAKIVGKVVVGNNAVIGANAVVNKDVPPNTLVVAQPVRFVVKEIAYEKENTDNS